LLDGNFAKFVIYYGVCVAKLTDFGLWRADMQEWGRSGSCSQLADC